MIYDTDVLIWMFRGSAKAATLISGDNNKCISIITLMELLKGASNRQEASHIRRVIKSMNFSVLPADENISHRALIYIEEFGLKTGISIADALIAATAAEHAEKLCTSNTKDYRSISEIALHQYKDK